MTSLSETSMLAGSSGVTSGYTIDQSIRFDAASDSLMYSPTPSSSKNFTTTATLSLWTKLGNIDGTHYLAGAYYGTNARYDLLMLDSSNRLRADGRSGGASTSNGTGVTKWTTNQVFRDPSAWYHIVLVYDTTNAVPTQRFRLYINGSRVTDFNTNPSYGASELVYWFGKSSYSVLGSFWNTTGYDNYFYWDGYIAEAHGIDGYAYDAEHFGEFKEDTDIWIPKEFEGNYGTDGFYIKGEDSSDLGNDSSGNNKDFTLTNLAAHDQVLDSPTNNFCVLNPNDNRGTPGTLSEGNLKYAGAATYDNVTGIQGMSSGKWYWEVYIVDSDFSYLGVQDGGVSTTGYAEKAVALVTGDSVGTIHEDDSNSGNDSFIAENGEIVGVAVDIDNQKIWWSLDGQWYRADQASTATINQSEVEAGNQGFSFSSRSPTTGFFVPYVGNYTHATTISNFGQEGTFAGNVTAGNNTDGNGIGNFKYSVPSGFLALCTSNLGS